MTETADKTAEPVNDIDGIARAGSAHSRRSVPWWRRLVRALSRRRETDWRFTLAMGALFAVVQVVGHAHHEMWRDELHHWGIGRDSGGLWDLLIGERRYEGHPFLWHYLIYIVSRLTRSYVALHVVTAALAIAGALIWLRYAPVPRVLRILLLGSYYLVYEYGIMSRNYTLGVLLTFVFCALYQPYRPRYVALGVVLALLAATSMYGTILGVAFGFFVFSSGPLLMDRNAGHGRRRLSVSLDWVVGVAILAFGLAVVVLTTWPPADAHYAPSPIREVTVPVIQELLAQFWRAMFPFRDVNGWNWPGGDALFSQSPRGAAAMPYLGALWFVAIVIALRRSPRVALTYALGALMMAAAQHTIYGAGWRHLGHYFILLVACLWLHARETRGRAPERALYGLLAVTTAVQILTGFAALRTDYVEHFSGSLEAAHFMQREGLLERPVVANPDDPLTSLAVILDKPFLFPITGETTETTLFRVGRHDPSQAELLEDAGRLARAGDGSALLILDYDLGPETVPGVSTRLIFAGGPSILGDESYRIYDVRSSSP